MQILRRGSEGDEVRRWQRFLVGQGLLDSGADGVFGPATEKATRAFQRLAKAGADGVVGPGTYAAALERGFDAGFTDPQGGQDGVDWPPRPRFRSLVSNEERARVFGAFRYEPVGPDAWNKLATVPALRGAKGSVRELVPLANAHGFYWGGHFSRADGMHFEVAQLRS